MDKTVISVIVPVYKVEPYLNRCVDSILSQTFKDFELILVDDGSPDNCGKICDEYAKKDKRVHVIHQKNQGLSGARNAGLDYSNGEYISFVDSDDYIDKNYLMNLFKGIKLDSDISLCNLKITVFSNEKSTTGDRGVVESNLDAIKCVLNGKYHGTSVCGMLVDKTIAKSVRFPINKMHEDDRTIWKYLLRSKNVFFTTNELYFYFRRIGSITRDGNINALKDELEASDIIVDSLKEYGNDLELAAENKRYQNYSDVLINNTKLVKKNKKIYKRIIYILKNKSVLLLKSDDCSLSTKLEITMFYLFGIYGLLFTKKAHNLYSIIFKNE